MIFLAVLLLFGAKRIPEIARGLGKGIKEFKTATREISDEIQSASREIDAVSKIEAPRQNPTPRSTTTATTETKTAAATEAKTTD